MKIKISRVLTLELAEGKNIPSVNNPRVTPPTIPLKLIATCMTLPSLATMKTYKC